MSLHTSGPLAEKPATTTRQRIRFDPGRSRSWAALSGLALLALYLGSGLYLVDTDEQAVVRRFGAVVARVGPGMHYRLPWPVDQVDVLKTTSVMKTGVGFDLSGSGQRAMVGMELLTGDTNILSVALVLQYVVDDPTDFLFRTEDPRALIGSLGETVLTEAVVGMSVDEVLTTGRLEIQERVKTGTQAMLDRYESGIHVTSSNIMAITLDRSVAEAFQDVTDAMADRERARNEAQIYANNLIPKARGEAHALVRAAEGQKQQRRAEAIGNSGRFLAVLEEYEKAPEITRERLYLEAMEKVLPRVRMYVIDSKDGEARINLRVR